MKESVNLTATFNATAEEVYNAWLSSDEHTLMTGGGAECSHEIGAPHSAWDGYIWGVNKSLKPNEEIVQTWRSAEFHEYDEDSILTIRLSDKDGKCILTLIHEDIPEGQTQYEDGWVDNYFDPMTDYFNKR